MCGEIVILNAAFAVLLVGQVPIAVSNIRYLLAEHAETVHSDAAAGAAGGRSGDVGGGVSENKQIREQFCHSNRIAHGF